MRLRFLTQVKEREEREERDGLAWCMNSASFVKFVDGVSSKERKRDGCVQELQG